MTAHPPDRFAVVSDIHGNRRALEAVVADIARRGVSAVVNLGDSLYGPLHPAGTAERLIALGWPAVRGNEDRIIGSSGDDAGTLRFVRAALRPAHLDWLRALPAVRTPFDGVWMCHGTPSADDVYLLHDVTPGGAVRRPPSGVEDLLDGVDAPLVLCGHDHVPGDLTLPGGRRVIDPGSVGLPAYTDDTPFPHRMEAGSPEARYTILTRDGAGWQDERIAVPYDHDAAAAAAAGNGRPDWAAWLRSGRATARGGTD
jgi:diadenosine tetraphosphatase ApaH/serine/threonine PP2A family protein phosphatase